jgi:hypothetical protein
MAVEGLRGKPPANLRLFYHPQLDAAVTVIHGGSTWMPVCWGVVREKQPQVLSPHAAKHDRMCMQERLFQMAVRWRASFEEHQPSKNSTGDEQAVSDARQFVEIVYEVARG